MYSLTTNNIRTTTTKVIESLKAFIQFTPATQVPAIEGLSPAVARTDYSVTQNTLVVPQTPVVTRLVTVADTAGLNLLDLPNDVLNYIFSFFTLGEVMKIARTSKRFLSVLSHINFPKNTLAEIYPDLTKINFSDIMRCLCTSGNLKLFKIRRKISQLAHMPARLFLNDNIKNRFIREVPSDLTDNQYLDHAKLHAFSTVKLELENDIYKIKKGIKEFLMWTRDTMILVFHAGFIITLLPLCTTDLLSIFIIPNVGSDYAKVSKALLGFLSCVLYSTLFNYSPLAQLYPGGDSGINFANKLAIFAFLLGLIYNYLR